MRRPRILLILTEFPPRIGGMQTHAIYLAKQLHARGYPIEVVTYQPITPYEKHAVRGYDRRLGFPVRRVMSRLGYHHNFSILERIAWRFCPDMVYASTIFYGDLARRLGVPVTARSVGNDVMRPWIAYPFAPFSKLVSEPRLEEPVYRFFRGIDYPEPFEALYREQRRQLMVASARQHSRVMANSQFTADLLREIGLGADQIQILTGGVDAQRFARIRCEPELRAQLEIPEDRFLMLTACRMVRKKGVDFLIDHMDQLVEKIPDAHLLLVGNGRHYKKFKRIAAASPASDRMTFLGKVPHPQIHRYYAIADCFLLASRVQVDPLTGLRDAETMGRVLCEANAAGVPVVAARSGGIPSVIEPGVNGRLFIPDHLPSLVETLQQLREEPEKTRQMAARGKQIAQKRFDWSAIVDAHERAFASILSSQHPSLAWRDDLVQIPAHSDHPSLPRQMRVVLDAPQEPDLPAAS